VAVSVSNVDLMERVCHLTNKIYQEMLCITRHDPKKIAYITIGPGRLDRVQVIASSSTTQYKIVLSRPLLAWISMEGVIPFSFSNFITTSELSGPLYISPDNFHTQITEHFLEKFYE
jgi:hypothetical protein